MGDVPPLNDISISQSVAQINRYPSSHNSLPISPTAASAMCQLGGPQELFKGLDLQTSLEQYNSLPQQHDLGHESNENTSQISIGEIRPPHEQNHSQFQQNGCLQQETTQVDEEGNVVRHGTLQEPSEPSGRAMNDIDWIFDGDSTSFLFDPDPLDPDFLESVWGFGGGLYLPLDGQQLTMQNNAAPEQFMLGLNGHHYRSQTLHHQSTLLAAAEPFATSSGNDQIHALPRQQHVKKPVKEWEHISKKHQRSSSTFSDPTQPPQPPLSKDLPELFRVVHKGSDVKCNRLAPRSVRGKGGSMNEIKPDRLPSEPPRKRVRRESGTESRDSMFIYSEHLKARGASASHAEQTAIARGSLNLRPNSNLSVRSSNLSVRSSNLSVRSSLRYSGSISKLDSTVFESIQSSFNNLKLTDTECMTDYKEADGYMEAKITIKGRWRKSQIGKLPSSGIGLPP